MVEQLSEYYRARGWGDDGVPLPLTVAKVDLADYARPA